VLVWFGLQKKEKKCHGCGPWAHIQFPSPSWAYSTAAFLMDYSMDANMFSEFNIQKYQVSRLNE
jgi:hypothetical protein